jgi:hypothetical protein
MIHAQRVPVRSCRSCLRTVSASTPPARVHLLGPCQRHHTARFVAQADTIGDILEGLAKRCSLWRLSAGQPAGLRSAALRPG